MFKIFNTIFQQSGKYHIAAAAYGNRATEHFSGKAPSTRSHSYTPGPVQWVSGQSDSEKKEENNSNQVRAIETDKQNREKYRHLNLLLFSSEPKHQLVCTKHQQK